MYGVSPIIASTWTHIQSQTAKFCGLTCLCVCVQGRIASGEDVFGPLIDRYLLANKHRVTVELLPDQQLAAKEDEAEKAELAAFKQKLVESELQEVIRSTQELKERQVPNLHHHLLFAPVFAHVSKSAKGLSGSNHA